MLLVVVVYDLPSIFKGLNELITIRKMDIYVFFILFCHWYIFVYYYRQYFVVILKDGPFELWDLRNLCILRTMPKKFPTVSALVSFMYFISRCCQSYDYTANIDRTV
jgi:hypothetical protein